MQQLEYANENQLHLEIGNWIKEREQKLEESGVFITYTPFGELRDGITAALLKRKGTKKGIADYMVIKTQQIYWIECKVKKNFLSKEQKQFRMLVGENKFFECRSLIEWNNILKNILTC